MFSPIRLMLPYCNLAKNYNTKWIYSNRNVENTGILKYGDLTLVRDLLSFSYKKYNLH